MKMFGKQKPIERIEPSMTWTWNEMRDFVTDIMRDRDRTVNICITPEGSVSISIYPWSRDEDEDEK